MDPIEEIKKRVDIVEFISEYTPLKKMGRNFAAQCPFHQETKPSFMVSPDRQIFRCFGCEAKGDIFGFLERKEGLTFPEALEVLAKRANVKLSRFEPRKKSEKERIISANTLASELYNYLLTRHKVGEKARDYLKKRGISDQSIKSFQIGFAPRSSVLVKFFEKKGFALPEIVQAGLVVAREGGRYFDRFYDRLIFPLRDLRGQVLGFSGRLVDNDDTHKVNDPKYLNGPETPVFQKGALLFGIDLAKDSIRENGEAILVEGEFDVISSYQAGVKNVVGVKGTAFTQDQIKLLSRFTDNIAICFDTDLAGDAAARRGIELADQAGMNIKVIQTGNFKDPDEMIKKSKGEWERVVSEAVPVYDWLITSALTRFDRKTAEGKKKIGQELLPILNRVSDEIVKAHYIATLSQKLDVSEDALVRALNKSYSRKTAIEDSLESSSQAKHDPYVRLYEYFISLLLQGTEFINSRVNWPQVSDFPDGLLKKLYERIIISQLGQKTKTKEKFRLGDFVGSLEPELIEEADRLLLANIGEPLGSQETFEKEFLKTVSKIRELGIQSELKDLSKKIKEREAEDKQAIDLQKKFDVLRDELAQVVKRI